MSELVWVSGARGLLGRELVPRLEARGLDVLATGHEVDISDRAALERALAGRRVAAIFNAAAYTAVDLAETERAAALATNADGAAEVAAVAREHGAVLVHFSTDYVFGGAVPEVREPLGEDAPTAPLGHYGASKLAGEARVLESIGGAERVYVVRTSWLFGAHGASFVSRMLELFAERRELSVVDDQHGRPTAAGDLADVAVALADGPLEHAPSGVYHFANAGITTWHGFAVAIREAALRHGWPVVTEVIHAVDSRAFARPAPRPRWSALATDKLEALLAAPIRPWSEALDEHLARLR